MPLSSILFILGIVALAAFVKSAFGFGEGMVNMALLSLVVGLDFAGPFVALIMFAGSLYILLRDGREIRFRELRMLLIAAFLFIPLGIWMSMYANEKIMKTILGSLILAFSLYKLIAPNLGQLKSEYWGLLFGAIGGLFGGAYNVSGPPAALYGSMRGWRPEVFRVTLQGYFAPIALMALNGRVLAGQYTGEILWIALYSLPAILIGILLGKITNQKIKNPKIFHRIIYSMLIVLGILLIF